MQWWVSWLTWFQRFSILLHLIFAYFWWKKVQIFSANQEIQVKNDALFSSWIGCSKFFSHYYSYISTMKKAEPWKGWEGVNLIPPCGFSKYVSSRERWFFVTFNIIRTHIFPENFIEISQVIKKIWSNSFPTRKKLLSKSPSLLGLKSTKYG